MASWCREGRVRRGRSPGRPCGREAAECVQLWAPAVSPRLLERLLRDMQEQVDDMHKMRAALLDAAPGLCAAAQQQRPAGPAAAAAAGGGGGYSFSVDVAGFAPSELSVQVQGRRLRVCAKRDQRNEAADGCLSHEYREVRKEVLLPDDADLQAVACALEPDGLLCVRAPRRPPPDPQPRDIPIAVAGAPLDDARKAASPDGPEEKKAKEEKKEPPAAQP